MLTLRPTRQLARRLRIELPDTCWPVASPYADWSVHAFTAARLRYLILTNTASLLSVVTAGRGVTDETRLVGHASHVLGDYLRGSGRAFFFERFIVPELEGATFVPIGSRSVLGSINELVFQARWFLEKSDLSPFEASDRINKCPMTLLRSRAPADAFPELVGPTA